MQIIKCSDLPDIHEYPLDWVETQLFYFIRGRNAWNSTTVRNYYADKFSFDLQNLKIKIENQREKGSYFFISTVPLLAFKFRGYYIGIGCVNEHIFGLNYSLEQLIIKMQTQDPGATGGEISHKINFLQQLEDSDAFNTFLFFKFDNNILMRYNLSKKFTPFCLKSYSNGNPERYLLGWNDSNVYKNEYNHFKNFSYRLLQALTSNSATQ